MGLMLLQLACVVLVMLRHGTDAQVTVWASAITGSADVAVVADFASTSVADSAAGTAGVTLRDGLVAADGTLLTVTATSDNALTYTLDTASKNTFEISGAPGVIKVKTEVTISHSATSTYTVTVTATETDTPAQTGVLTLTVTVNGMPTFSSTPICMNIADAIDIGTTLYTYTIADPESTTVTTSIISGDEDSYFTSPIISGKLLTAKAMDKATNDRFVLVINAVDAGTPKSTASTSLTVLVKDEGTGTSICSGGAVAMGSVMTTLALLIAYYL